MGGKELFGGLDRYMGSAWDSELPEGRCWEQSGGVGVGKAFILQEG